MPASAAKEAIRFLDKEIAAAIDRSAKGSVAYSEANLSGPSHIGAVIVSAEQGASHDAVAFRAFVELYDEAGAQYEAQVTGTCTRFLMREGSWRLVHLEVIDAGPLPKGG